MSRIFAPLSYFLFSAALLALLFTADLVLAKSYGTIESIATAATPKSNGAVHIDGSKDKIYFFQNIEYFLETDSGLKIEDIESSKIKPIWSRGAELKQVPKFGFTDKAVWFRFQVNNDTPEDIDKLFEIDLPTLNKIDFYIRPSIGSPMDHQWIFISEIPTLSNPEKYNTIHS